MDEAGQGAAQKEERQEAKMPHGVLDVVAEDPEEQHVAEDVERGAVQEKAGRQGHPLGHERQPVRQDRRAE